MRKIWAVLLLAALLFCLSSCAASKNGGGIPEGTYKAMGFADASGEEVTDESVPMFNDISIVITDSDTAEMVYGEQKSKASYRLEGEKFILRMRI